MYRNNKPEDNTAMYKNTMYKGKTLAEWQKVFKFEYSLGELYRLALSNSKLFEVS